jgi:hypothetical protein
LHKFAVLNYLIGLFGKPQITLISPHEKPFSYWSFTRFTIICSAFGWRVALYAIAALILLCAFCGLLFRPLKMPEIDAEQNIKLSEEMKQQALLAALSRADGEEVLFYLGSV